MIIGYLDPWGSCDEKGVYGVTTVCCGKLVSPETNKLGSVVYGVKLSGVQRYMICICREFSGTGL